MDSLSKAVKDVKLINIALLLTFIMSTILPNINCHMDIEELKSVYYGLDILKEPVLMDEHSPKGAVHVTSKYGQTYQCTFPDHSLEEKKKEEEEKLAVETGVVEMLKPLASKDCLFKTKDWWSYEFCYGKYVRQYHMEDGEIRGIIMYLGYYESDFDWNNETAKTERLKGSINGFHSQSYTQGSHCDLTGKPRATEVRFMCEENSEDYLARIDESETCVYTMTIMTSRICPHPYFKSPVQRKSVPITCKPLLNRDQFHQFHEARLGEWRRLQALKAEQEAKKAAAKKEKFLLPSDEGLSKVLEDQMSAQAKELLGGSLDKLFAPRVESQEMTREEFETTFGKKEYLWQLYQKTLAIKKKRKETKLKEEEEKESQTEKGSQEEKDEDDEIISEFENEIEEVKYRYRNSQNKLANIRRKMTKERNWESEIENAIQEAEQEFGLKVDRSLVAGLSDTLDKLVNKLEDTEAELNSMDEEINNLKPENVKIKNSQGTEESAGESSPSQNDAKEGKVAPNEEGMSDSASRKSNDDDEEDDTVDKKIEKPVVDGSIEDKIEAPPSTGQPRKDSSQGEQSTFPRPKDVSEEGAEGSLEGQSEGEGQDQEDVDLKVKLSLAGDEAAEAELKKLPSNIRKLLEDSVRKEYEKRSVKRGNERLGLDDDHSFTRDKSVHVFQQEDEEGKTNRFIFVLGFNNFDDESAELQRQNTLEENYGFVYQGDRKSKSTQEDSDSSEPER